MPGERLKRTLVERFMLEEQLRPLFENLARLRLRPTRRIYWLSHSGGSGALIDAFIERRSYDSLAFPSCLAVTIRDVRSIAQEPAGLGALTPGVDGWYRIVRGERHDLHAAAEQHSGAGDRKMLLQLALG